MKGAQIIVVRIGDTGPVLTFRGREAWAISELANAINNGVTPIENPGPRWSAYVHKLRKAGLVIDTVRERHCGPFPGDHARYVLRSPVVVLRDDKTEPDE